MSSSAINSAVLVLSENTVIFKNIQQSTHLGEDENATALFPKSLKEFVENGHLARVVNKVLVGCAGLGLALAACTVDSIDILLQNLLVPFDLHLRHAQVDVHFLLRQQTFLYVALHTAQQERTKHSVQLLYNCVLVPVLARKPLVEGLRVTKNIGQQEVEKCPQFVKLLQMRFLSQHHLVTRDANIELFVNESLIDEVLSLVFGTLKYQNVNFRCPPGKLSLPVVEGRFGNNNQVRSSDVKDVSELSIFFSLGASTSLARGTSLPPSTLLGARSLSILSIDLGHDVPNLGVWVRLDEMAE
ncbi:hypothetical protein HG530_013397 [Fusarium avenaceum]|nr:hypothetical protein HG530_013397 [Fusarium avenaceum]